MCYMGQFLSTVVKPHLTRSGVFKKNMLVQFAPLWQICSPITKAYANVSGVRARI